MKMPFHFALFLLIAAMAGRAWGHGFILSLPGYNGSSPPPASFSVFSNQPVLDFDPDNPTPGPHNLFLDQFGATPNGDGSYGTFEGFAQVNGPQPTILSATFHVLSPLYFSDGTGPAVLPSDGTRLHISYADSAGDGDGGTNWPAYFASNPGIDISGSTSLVDGFALAPTTYALPAGTADPAFHQLQKDIYIADPSQTNGEYGFAFGLDVTFATGSGSVTVSSGPLVDVFATDIGAGGGFATNADPFTMQDPATLAIYTAAVPEPSAIALTLMGAVVIGVGGCRRFRRRSS
jgi:hypothetical protein